MTYPHGETITILEPATPVVDGDGDPVLDQYGDPTHNPPTETTVDGVAVAPGDNRADNQENNNQQSTVEVAFTLYFDHQRTISPHAQVIVRGNTYEVEGRSRYWSNPWTGDDGTELVIRSSQ